MSEAVEKSFVPRRSFSEYKLENAKLLRDALIISSITNTNTTNSTNSDNSADLTTIIFESVSKFKSATGLIPPLINIVSEYSLSLPNYKSTSEGGDADYKSLVYYFSGWQEIIDNFPDVVHQSVGQGCGFSKLANILRHIAVEVKVEKVGIWVHNLVNNDRVCELAAYGLLSEECSNYEQRSLCRQCFVPHLPAAVVRLCSGAFVYNRDLDLNLTFWENLVSILWTRPGVDIFVGTRKIENIELQVRKQKAINCIRNYHSFRNSSRACDADLDVENANAQFILLLDHLLN